MSVFDAMVKMKRYIKNCPTEKMQDAAKNDFIAAIKELIDVGYTWGRRHPLPVDVQDLRRLPKRELRKLVNMLLNA
tara:strand:- start:2244 stop:2471 length:228 start_codon:yes stop_codon:yes gene_type:complete